MTALGDLAEIAAYPLKGAAMCAGLAYGVASLLFQRVDSVHACPATGIGLQRAATAANDLRLFELASIARESEPWEVRVQQQSGRRPRGER